MRRVTFLDDLGYHATQLFDFDAQGLALLEKLRREHEPAGGHAIHRLDGRELVLDREDVIILGSQKLQLAGDFPDVGFREHNSFGHFAVGSLHAHLDGVDDEGNRGLVGDPEIGEDDRAVTVGQGSNLEDLAFQLHVGSTVHVENSEESAARQQQADQEASYSIHGA